MGDEAANPVDLSADAALELEEVDQGKRQDAPSLDALFLFLRTPVSAPPFQGNDGLSMLSDVRAYAILRDSIGNNRKQSKASDFASQVEAYLAALEAGVRARETTKVREAKRFCLALSDNLLSRKLSEIYQRYDRTNSRYIDYDAIS